MRQSFLIISNVNIFLFLFIMNTHQTLQKVTEESLTLEDCKFLLSKTGEKQSKIIFENYYKKYHPKNSSLTSYFNRKMLELISNKFVPQQRPSARATKISRSVIELPVGRREKKGLLSEKWQKIIAMTEKQNISRKGCLFPQIDINIKRN